MPRLTAVTGWPLPGALLFILAVDAVAIGAQDLEALARTIEEAGAEIVALQEVSRGWLVNGSTEMLTWLPRGGAPMRRVVMWADVDLGRGDRFPLEQAGAGGAHGRSERASRCQGDRDPA